MTIRRWLYDHGIRWHAQNLSRDGQGSIWQEGRAWLNIFAGNGETGEGYRELIEINPEWYFRLQNRAGVGIAVGGGDSDRDLKFNFSLPLGSFYLTFDSLPKSLVNRILPGRWVDTPHGPYKHTDEHEISLNWHSNALWWYGWYSTMSWRSRDPWWRHGSFHPVDFLLGRTAYTKRIISEHQVEIPMPERAYPAKVTLNESTWTRPRWPFPKRLLRAEIECEEGVPHPGKGENAWDCGEDATYSLSCPARTVAEAVGAMVASVYRDRLRYGGQNWRPREVASA